MSKTYYDICYNILSHYLHFPNVADTYKSINNGLNYLRNFLKMNGTFWQRKKRLFLTLRRCG